MSMRQAITLMCPVRKKGAQCEGDQCACWNWANKQQNIGYCGLCAEPRADTLDGCENCKIKIKLQEIEKAIKNGHISGSAMKGNTNE